MTSQRLNPAYPQGRSELDSAGPNDSIVWDVSEYDSVVVQVVRANGAAWPASLVVTVEVSIDGAVFVGVPAGAVTFTANGLALITTAGVLMLRVRVSTADGTVAIGVVVAGNNDQ